MQNPSYEAHWRKHRRRWYVFLAVWLGWMPYGALTDSVLSGSLRFLAFGLWAVLFVWSGARIRQLMCPRCDKRFSTRGYSTHVFPARCLHCGLPHGAKTDPDWKAPELGEPVRTEDAPAAQTQSQLTKG